MRCYRTLLTESKICSGSNWTERVFVFRDTWDYAWWQTRSCCHRGYLFQYDARICLTSESSTLYKRTNKKNEKLFCRSQHPIMLYKRSTATVYFLQMPKFTYAYTNYAPTKDFFVYNLISPKLLQTNSVKTFEIIDYMKTWSPVCHIPIRATKYR